MLSSFQLCATKFPSDTDHVQLVHEGALSPYTEAAKALNSLLSSNAPHFVSNHAIAAIGAAWEASYAACNTVGILTKTDRIYLAQGISHVLGALPANQRQRSLLALAMPTMDCLQQMLQYAASRQPNDSTASLNRAAEEVAVLTAICTSYSGALNRSCMVEDALVLAKTAWPSIVKAATEHSRMEVRIQSLGGD